MDITPSNKSRCIYCYKGVKKAGMKDHIRNSHPKVVSDIEIEMLQDLRKRATNNKPMLYQIKELLIVIDEHNKTQRM